MENNKSLKKQKYRAIILPGLDPTAQGRYKVFIHTLMHQSSENPQDDWVWARNRVHGYRLGTAGTAYGAYSPLHPTQHCYIKFETDDINSAYISDLVDDIISPATPNTLPFGLSLNDRDQITVVSKTLNNHHSILITEASSVSPQSIQITYNGGSMHLVFDGSGVHLKATNLNITADQVNIKSSGSFNVDASTINLKGPINCGTVNSGKITGSITYADVAPSSSGSPPPEPSVSGVSISHPGLVGGTPVKA